MDLFNEKQALFTEETNPLKEGEHWIRSDKQLSTKPNNSLRQSLCIPLIDKHTMIKSMDLDIQIFDEIIQNELLFSCSSSDLSIYNGKTGLTLFFFHCFRHTGKQICEDIASELIDDIYEDIHTSLPIDFSSGLCGIGWGIEYLIQHKFLESSSDTLEEIDLKIMERDIRRIRDLSFETGLEGIVWYILLRLNSTYRPSYFDAAYEKELLETCKNHNTQISDSLLVYLNNRQISKYPYTYIFNQVLTGEAAPLSWKNGLKHIIQ